MRLRILTALLSAILLPSLAFADPWKDESGHGRKGHGWGERFGEPPPWARGKGYWDGHFKHQGPPAGPGYGYHPEYVRPLPFSAERWNHWEDSKEWAKERHERLKELREREREAYQKWSERGREHRQKLRERQREAFQKWREWQRDEGVYSAPPPPLSPSAPWR